MNRVGKKNWKYLFFLRWLEILVCFRNNWYFLGSIGNFISFLNVFLFFFFCVLGLFVLVGGCVLFFLKFIFDRVDVGVVLFLIWLLDDWLLMFDIFWVRYDFVYGNNWCYCLLVFFKFMILFDVYCKIYIKFIWLYYMFINSLKYFLW